MPTPTLPQRSMLPRLFPLLFPLLLAGCATPPPPVAVPANLEPGADTRLAATLSASGVQIYECRAAADAGAAPAWVFVAPEAELFDASGQRVGRHGAGPFWQGDDGSRIVGQVLARSDAPRAGAIPWLLLKAQSNGAPGRFAEVTHVQRIQTVGGAAPTAPCTAAQIGSTARTPYTADYRFFVRRG